MISYTKTDIWDYFKACLLQYCTDCQFYTMHTFENG